MLGLKGVWWCCVRELESLVSGRPGRIGKANGFVAEAESPGERFTGCRTAESGASAGFGHSARVGASSVKLATASANARQRVRTGTDWYGVLGVPPRPMQLLAIGGGCYLASGRRPGGKQRRHNARAGISGNLGLCLAGSGSGKVWVLSHFRRVLL